MAGEGHGPSSFGIPPRSGVPAWHPDNIPDEDGESNKYRRRIEDIDPARVDPSAMIEHHEPLRPRPSPYTVEGYIQGFRDLSEAAITGHGQRRARARLLVILSLTALCVPVGLQLLGFLHIL
ncbi:MAG TPA: hypothetical protein VHZ96_24050 [Frankiaceae bacterium]|jgi:hypothetical protein|nr:hypothetical protein [Frankiaceae bacterium]